MDDNLALLVGRVILAFGTLDSTLTNHIQMMRMEVEARAIFFGRETPAHTEIDDRFNQRLSEFRRQLVNLEADDAVIRRFDVAHGDIQRISRHRGHLAHSMLSHQDGAVHVHDHRELRKYFQERDTLREREVAKLKKTGQSPQDTWDAYTQKLGGLRKEYIDISYTAADLAALVEDIKAASDELRAIRYLVDVPRRPD